MNSAAQNTGNEELGEAIDNLLRLCSRERLPVMLAIQESPDSIRTLTANESLMKSTQIKLMKMAIRSPDVDHFFRELIRDAQSNGHDSLFLKAMGIPEKLD